MTTMLDKITAAMVANDSGPEGSFLFDIHSPEFSVGYRESLLAALEVMRVPDEAMKSAVRDIGGGQWVANALSTWPTMIDAIISEAKS